MYQVQMQFIPGNDSIWVFQLTPNDHIYQYNNEVDAQMQSDALQAADTTGRQYRVIFM